MDPQRFRLRIYAAVFFFVMIVGTVGFSIVEGFPTADAFYFTIVTIATVGYGDIHPVTPTGKLLSVFLIVFGVGTFMAVIASATELMLNRREKAARIQRLNRIIGVFFGQMGTRLLGSFASLDADLESLGGNLVVKADWKEGDFHRVEEALASHSYKVRVTPEDLQRFHQILQKNTPLVLQLFENPNLVEHESFSDLLHAVLHLTEELAARSGFHHLPDTDKAHLEGDIRRIYMLLVREWLAYMAHLKEHYPYLFSLALRTNPFDRSASPVVT